MTHILELAYLHMREIVAVLERELESAEMVAFYGREPLEGAAMPGGSRVHHAYMVERARKALDQARAALSEIQIMAYERGLVESLPEIS